MGTLRDHSCMFAVESTFGAAVTVTRGVAMLPDSSHEWDPRMVYGEGLVVSSHGFVRGARRVNGRGKGQLTIKAELGTTGFGLLLQLCHAAGQSASNVVSGSTYQQRHTGSRTTPVLPSGTFQLGLVRADASGTVDATTYYGCTVQQFTISVPDSGIAQIEVQLDALGYDAGTTAYATPSYVGNHVPMHRDFGSVQLGGTLTVPTTTVLGSLASPTVSTARVKSWSFMVNYNVDRERDNVGARSQPLVTTPEASLTIDAEHIDNVFRDAFYAGTALPFVGTIDSGVSLSTGTALLQVVVPQAFVDDGGLAQPTNGEVPKVSHTLKVTYDGTNAPWYIVQRTAETSL